MIGATDLDESWMFVGTALDDHFVRCAAHQRLPPPDSRRMKGTNMKLRITTLISLVGVLGAGSAAALVNTQVLQNSESNSKGNISVASQSNSEASGTTASGDQGTKINAEVTKINSSVLTSTQAMYQIGEAGVITLDTAGNVLAIVSATPNSGWTVVKSESNGASIIEVKLQSADTLIEFTATLQNGAITTTVESKFVGTTGDTGATPGSGNTPGTGSIDDDQGEDEDEDDDDGIDVEIDVEVHHGDDGGDDD